MTISLDPVLEFPLYQPVSAGDAHARELLTVLSVKQTIPILSR